MRDIKRRIKSVNNTKQITKAMELVSSAKLRKSRLRLDKSRPYFITIRKTVEELIGSAKGINHDFLNAREVKKSLYIAIAGDRGLAGGYNTNAIKKVLEKIEDKDKATIIAVGQKSRDFFHKKNYNLVAEFTHIAENPCISDAKNMADICIDLYNKGEIDEVYLIYTEFVSTISHKPRAVKLLPLDLETKKIEETVDEEESEFMEFNPSVEGFLEYLVPKYVQSVIYGALIESGTSEQGARRVAMESATENAYEMIGKLELQYNRARQASITQEIAEIVGGAEALK